MAHPNEDLLRRGYEAFATGNFDAMRELLAEDVVWHAVGRGPLAGDYRGYDEVFGLFAKTFELSGGTFSIEIHDVVANDEHGAAIVVVRGEREGRRLESRQAHIFHIRDGRAAEFWGLAEDQYAFDEFFA